MPVEYINYKGVKYYLHEGITKKGNPKHFFSKNLQGNILDQIPNGYEIYETPNGQVFLRKAQSQIVTNGEIQIIKDSIPKGLRTKIDAKKNIITIYLSDNGLSRNYQAMMRFILIDINNRTFEAERYCFRGSIDDWIHLDRSSNLRELSKKCCIHLGKESFYDLPYMVDGF